MDHGSEENDSMIISDIVECGEGDNRKLPVMLLNFTHASCNVDAVLSSNPSVDLELKEWEKNRKRPVIDLELKTSHLTYKNTDYEDKYYNTFLAIRDKKTGKTRLIEAMDVMMKPQVEYPKSTNPVLLKVEDDDRITANKDLIKNFGQSKGKRFYENKEKFQVNVEDTEAKIQKVVAGVDVESMATPAETQSLDIVPPRDETAGRADMIYRVEHFLSESEVNDMMGACSAVLEEYNSAEAIDKGQDDKIFSPLGAYFLKKQLEQSAEVLDQKCSLILYLDSIIKFSKLRPQDLRQADKVLPQYLPKTIKRKLVDVFSTGPARNRIVTPELKDKAVCYTIALCLALNKCNVDVALIAESMRFQQRHLKQLVTLVGAWLVVDPGTSQQKIVLQKTLAKYDVNYVAKRRK